ncbi:hypothetical protein CYLTODRAFT_460114 [Cylindrobasidium torrendii FP15055 ss-10]|uniref:Uncharacterized protein n=1 Tax=Cylindrobasidium torrendii FP15055 ss-10 TaxID=1314674 RepID=A0A0D7ASY5_9AGAR|nr:hypothetical protein CYLTODRAFT_460114 [Cylindrobasidium torrendii FP15055 ss-10]
MHAALFQPNFNLVPTVQLPTLPATTTGHVPPLAEGTKYNVTGGAVGLIKQYADLTILVSSPNMNSMVDPLYGWRSISLHCDFRFGPDDCFVHPQIWRSCVGHLATIPWPSSNSNLSMTHWKVFGDNDLERHAPDDLILGKLQLFVLKTAALDDLDGCHKQSRDRFRRLEDEWGFGRSQLSPWDDPPARALYQLQQVLLDRLRVPAESEQIIARVCRLQRTILELHGRLNWLSVLPDMRDPPTKPLAVREDWVGALCGSEEIADRMYRASIPVWLVRPGRSDNLPSNVGKWDKEQPSQRRQCMLNPSVMDWEYDPFRPYLCHKSAGDVERYTIMDDYLVQLSNPQGEAQEEQHPVPKTAAPYFESLQDRRFDLRVPPAKIPKPSVSSYHETGSNSPINICDSSIPTEDEDEPSPHLSVATSSDLPSPCTVQSQSVQPPSPVLDATQETTGYKSVNQSHRTQGGHRVAFPPPGTQDRDKFVDIDHPDLPRMLESWSKASERVRNENRGVRLADTVGIISGTALMDPNVLVRQDDVKFKTALKLHDILMLRLELPPPLVGSLRPKEWNWILGLEVLNEPGKANTRGRKRRDEASRLLRAAIEMIPHAKHVDTARLSEVEPRWRGRLIDTVSPRDRREFSWEVGEANFRFELLSLDRHRYTLRKPVKESLCEAPDSAAYGQSHEWSWLDSTSWDERQSKLYTLFPHWRSSLKPDISLAHKGFASKDFAEAGRAVLGLWQLMGSWKESRIRPDEGSDATLEELERVLLLSLPTSRKSDLLLSASETVAYLYVANFVDVFRRAPFLPRSLN